MIPRLKFFIILTLTLPFACCFSQVKDKSWLLVDGIVFEKLSSPDKEQLGSFLKAYHSSQTDSVKLQLLEEFIEACLNETIWPKYNLLMLQMCENKQDRLHLIYKATAIHNIGFEAQHKGQIQKAIEYFNASLEIEKKLGSKSDIASSYLNLAYIFEKQGNVEKAISYLSESLKLYEELDNKKGIARSLNNMAVIYDEQHDAQKAFEYHNRSLKISEALSRSDNKNDAIAAKRDIAFTLINMANLNDFKIAVKNNRPRFLSTDLAIVYTKRALSILSEIGDKPGLAGAYVSMGSLYNQCDSIEQSFKCLNKAAELYKEADETQGIANATYLLGNMYYKTKDDVRAKEMALRSFAMAKELGFPENIRNASGLLYSIYKRNNEPGKALEMYEMFVRMRDSLSNENTRKASLKQQYKYDYEKKETELKAKALVETEKAAAIASEEKARKNLIIAVVGAGLLIVLIFSIFLYNRFRITQKQKGIIEEQKLLVDIKNKEIVDSINYAKRIQKAHLPTDKYVAKSLDRLSKKS
jgi:tetratricopeptide (TPR) repeat protein